MVVTSEGLGGAKEKIKRGGRGTSRSGTANGKMTDKTIHRFVDQLHQPVSTALACVALLILWEVFL